MATSHPMIGCTPRPRALEKLHRAKQICRVRDGQRGHGILGSLAHGFVNTNNAIRNRKLGVEPKVNEWGGR
jgi:hypothetical protein